MMPRSTAYKSSFFPDVVAIWNDLPLELRSLQSLSVFKNEVLNYWHTDS